MKLLYKCRSCRKDRTAKSFVKTYWNECRACMKKKYLFYKKALSK